jgi:hypothetical protein
MFFVCLILEVFYPGLKLCNQERLLKPLEAGWGVSLGLEQRLGFVLKCFISKLLFKLIILHLT